MNNYSWATGMTRDVFIGKQFADVRAAFDTKDSTRLRDALTLARQNYHLSLNYATWQRDNDEPMLVYADALSFDGVSVCPNGEQDTLLRQWEHIVRSERYFGTVEFDLANTRDLPEFEKLFISPDIRGRVKLWFQNGHLKTRSFDFMPDGDQWQFDLTRRDVATANQSRAELALHRRCLLILTGDNPLTCSVSPVKPIIDSALARGKAEAEKLSTRLALAREQCDQSSSDAQRVTRTGALNPTGVPVWWVDDITDHRATLVVGLSELVDNLYKDLADAGAILYLSPLDKMFQWDSIRHTLCLRCADRRAGHDVRCVLHDSAVTPRPLRELIDKPYWSQTSFCRWPRNHAVVLDACLVLLDEPFPPYVLLEILDWFPYMDWQSRFAKVRLIEAVSASIRSVRQRRVEINKRQAT